MDENVSPWIQEALRTPSQKKVQKASSGHNIIKLFPKCDKRKILKVAKEKTKNFIQTWRQKKNIFQTEMKIILGNLHYSEC